MKYWVPIFVMIFYIRTFWNPLFTLKFSPTKKKKSFQIFCLFFMIAPYPFLILYFGSSFLFPFLVSTLITLFISDPYLLSQHTYFERKYYENTLTSPTIPPREQDAYTRELIFSPLISNLIFYEFQLSYSSPLLPLSTGLPPPLFG